MMSKIALINMPFASIEFPSLALSTLKAECEKSGQCCKVFNFNLLFAKYVGVANYLDISDEQHIRLGEQIFSNLLFQARATDAELNQYISKVVCLDEFNQLVSKANNFICDCADLILQCSPKLVGFTTSFFQTIPSLCLAKEIKKRDPKVLVVFGGASCEEPMGSGLLKSYEYIDLVFSGEADKTFPEFIAKLTKTKEESFVSSMQSKIVSGEQTELDDLSTPDHSDYFADLKIFELETEIEPKFTFETSRGCWWGERSHCTFCGLNGGQMAYRAKSHEIALEQLKAISASVEKAHVLFSDNILNYKYFGSLFNQLKEVSNLSYFFEVKSNLKEQQLIDMKEAGVVTIQPGIERLNDHVLKIMKKGNSTKQNVQLIKWAADYNIKLLWNMIVSFPNECPKALEQEISLVKKLKHLPPPGNIGPVRVDRYSPFYKTPEKYGICLKGASLAERYLHYECPFIEDICYHFEHQNSAQASDQVVRLTETLTKEINDWRDNYKPNTLTYDDDGKVVAIKDYRDEDNAHVIELTGNARKLYLFCNQFNERHRVERSFGSSEVINCLLDLGVMLSVDNKLLSVAVRSKAKSKIDYLSLPDFALVELS